MKLATPTHCICSPNGSVVFTGLNATETAFSEELIAYWVPFTSHVPIMISNQFHPKTQLSFVRSSNPNKYKLSRSPEWPSFSLSSQGQRLVLQQDPHNTTTMSGVVAELEPPLEAQRCEFSFSKADELEN